MIKFKLRLLVLMVFVLITGCSTTHIKDENGNTLMSVYSGKTSDGLDWTHGAYVSRMYEFDENGQPTGRMAHDYQVKSKTPFLGNLFIGATSGAAGAAIFAGTGGMGCRGGRCGGGGGSTTFINNPTAISESDASSSGVLNADLEAGFAGGGHH